MKGNVCAGCPFPLTGRDRENAHEILAAMTLSRQSCLACYMAELREIERERATAQGQSARRSGGLLDGLPDPGRAVGGR